MVQLHSKTMMFAESFGIGGEGMRTTDVVLPQVLANRLAIHLETQLKCLFSLLAGYLLKKGNVCTFFFFESTGVLFRLFLLASKKQLTLYFSTGRRGRYQVMKCCVFRFLLFF